MAPRKKPPAQPQTTGGPIPQRMHLPKDVALDPTTLPPPRLEAWSGWASAPQPQREGRP
jgi:hypothetical protein